MDHEDSFEQHFDLSESSDSVNPSGDKVESPTSEGILEPSEDEQVDSLISNVLASVAKKAVAATLTDRFRCHLEYGRVKVQRDLAVQYAQAQLDAKNYDFFDKALPKDLSLEKIHCYVEAHNDLGGKTARGAVGTFITINPPEQDFEDFKQNLLVFITAFTQVGVSGFFTVEQRSSDVHQLYGPHVHIVLPDKVVRKREIEREVAGAFWGKKTQKLADHNFNLRFLKTELDVQKCLDYIDPSHDQKPDKMLKLQGDEILRQKLEFCVYPERF